MSANYGQGDTRAQPSAALMADFIIPLCEDDKMAGMQSHPRHFFGVWLDLSAAAVVVAATAAVVAAAAVISTAVVVAAPAEAAAAPTPSDRDPQPLECQKSGR